MARNSPDPQIIERDGTSQAGRVQAALDPGYVLVDERSALDLLAFAKQYARELRFYDSQDRPDGDWSGFLDGLALDHLAALVEEPAQLNEDDARRLGRPHLALLLAFLKLLRHPRDLINTLTRRHLEFYYEQVLRMSRKAAVADQVHVLLRLAPGVVQARLPEGTLLRAGKDSLGRERIYRTDRDLVVSRSKIARLSSVYVQKEVVGIREARELHKGPREEAFLRMLEIALGDPHPGDPLPKYYGQNITYDALSRKIPLLLDLKKLLDFAGEHLFMDFPDLHSMMQLKRRRDQADGEWQEINELLEKAGRSRLGNPTWMLNPADPRDFSANLVKAIGEALDFKRDGLPEVDTIDDLYHERNRLEVRAFIHAKLFLEDADFDRMMYLKIRIDSEWREINRILERAGRRKRDNPSYKLDPKMAPTAFGANLDGAIGPLGFATLVLSILPGVSSLDAYYDAILRIEWYFYMNAAQLGYILGVAEKPAEPGAAATEWNNVYRLLADAHTERVYAGRRQTLQNAVESATTEAAGFRAMLRIALGKDAADREEPSLQDLQEFVRSALDFGFLQGIQKRLDGGDITGDEWARVYQVVELAQRIRERLAEPVAQRETWLNLHAAADAMSVVASPAAEAAPDQRRWKTFGQQPAAIQDRSPPGLIGWAISSPMLLLGQGKRTVVLTLGFRAKGFDSAKLSELLSQEQKPFGIELSTEKGWLAIAPAVTAGDYQALTEVSRVLPQPLRAIQITLSLGEDAAAIAPPNRDAAGIATAWPMLRWMLLPLWSEKSEELMADYASFRDLTLVAVHIQTKVEGLTPSSIQNDDAVLNPKKPFEPFGTSPAVGSRFYVGDPEIVIKRLDKLTFHVEWRGVPSNLMQHYANYSDVGAFTTQISLVDNHLRFPLTKPPAPLFASPDATMPHKIDISNIPGMVETPGEAYHYEPLAELPIKKEVSAWPRQFQWELTPTDFQHQAYPALAPEKALAMAAAIAKSPSTADATKYVIKPPYTPRINSLRVDYTSSIELLVQDTGSVNRLFHVHPFGISPIEAEAAGGEPRLLPRYDNEGELYIGIQNATPPQALSLLFQMAEGSANPDLRPVPVEWSYLSGNRWLTLHEGNLLSDTTRGLIDSGIVEITLPPAAPSTRLPGDLYWIRAAVPYHPDSLCDTVAIHAQAVSATFNDRGNAPDHYCQKLPARTITKLVGRVPYMAAVEQPYPSRGGKAAEREQSFYTRVSERLRHKQRTLTIWDYERLVLERFPELYKVKCIPAQAGSPGMVEIIVIPGVRGQSIANPFEPKVPASLIAEIEAYLEDKRPAQAAIRVQSAHFVPVKVRVGVRFRSGCDEGFYKKRLNEEINRFLSPWAYDDGADITIGGKIFANSIVSFIDERDYVDYVATIRLFSSEDGRTFKPVQHFASQGYFVATGKPDGVLVAAQQHEIDIITDVGYSEKKFTGINYMKIGLDFIVARAG